MSPIIAYCVGGVISLGLTIVACIFLMGENKAKKLNNFWYTIHKLINFKSLIISKILKFLYVFSTCVAICIGFFLLFSVKSYGGWYGGGKTWMGGYGIALMILGPIVIRLVYELLMMFVILVENTIAIREKLTGKPADDDSLLQPKEETVPPNYVFCPKCGERYDENKGECPKCSGKKKEKKVKKVPDAVTK